MIDEIARRVRRHEASTGRLPKFILLPSWEWHKLKTAASEERDRYFTKRFGTDVEPYTVMGVPVYERDAGIL